MRLRRRIRRAVVAAAAACAGVSPNCGGWPAAHHHSDRVLRCAPSSRRCIAGPDAIAAIHPSSSATLLIAPAPYRRGWWRFEKALQTGPALVEMPRPWLQCCCFWSGSAARARGADAPPISGTGRKGSLQRQDQRRTPGRVMATYRALISSRCRACCSACTAGRYSGGRRS